MPQPQPTPEPAVTVTDRGFKHYEPISTTYGHVVKVYESSAASAPHVWLEIDAEDSDSGQSGTLNALLTVEQAEKLAAALLVAVVNHYQRADS